MKVFEKVYDCTNLNDFRSTFYSDLKNLYNWDIDSSYEVGKYNDNTHRKYVKIYLDFDMNAFYITIRRNGLSDVLAFSVSKSSRYMYLVAVTTDNGILISLSNQPFPNKSDGLVGIYKCVNRKTGLNSGYCAFGRSLRTDEYNVLVSASTTQTDSDSNLAHSPTYSGVTMTVPVMSKYSEDTPVDILEMAYLLEDSYSVNKRVLYNNKNYRQLNHILIPEE